MSASKSIKQSEGSSVVFSDGSRKPTVRTDGGKMVIHRALYESASASVTSSSFCRRVEG